MDVAVDNVSMLYRTWTKLVISEDHVALFTEARCLHQLEAGTFNSKKRVPGTSTTC